MQLSNHNHTDSMQLADELPMIYTVCIMSFAAFGHGISPKGKALLAVGLTGLACFITVCQRPPSHYPLVNAKPLPF